MVDFRQVVADTTDAPLRTTVPSGTTPDFPDQAKALGQTGRSAKAREAQQQQAEVKPPDQTLKTIDLGLGYGDEPPPEADPFIKTTAYGPVGNNIVGGFKSALSDVGRLYEAALRNVADFIPDDIAGSAVGIRPPAERFTEQDFNRLKGRRQIPFDDIKSETDAKLRIMAFDASLLLDREDQRDEDSWFLQLVGSMGAEFLNAVNYAGGAVFASGAKALAGSRYGSSKVWQSLLQYGDKSGSVVSAVARSLIEGTLTSAAEAPLYNAVGIDYTAEDVVANTVFQGIFGGVIRAGGILKDQVKDMNAYELLAEEVNVRHLAETGEDGAQTGKDVKKIVEAANKNLEKPVENHTPLKDKPKTVVTVVTEAFEAYHRAGGGDRPLVEMLGDDLAAAGRGDLEAAGRVADMLLDTGLIEPENVARLDADVVRIGRRYNTDDVSPFDLLQELSDDLRLEADVDAELPTAKVADDTDFDPQESIEVEEEVRDLIDEVGADPERAQRLQDAKERFDKIGKECVRG